MLIDTRNKSVNEGKGFNPTTQNQPIHAKASTGAKIAWVLLCIFTFWFFGAPIIWYVRKRNWLNAKQIEINKASSTIDVQLAQRRDTLIKLVDATKSSMKYEKEFLSDITKLRNVNTTSSSEKKVSAMVGKGFSKLIATMENYPKVASIETVQQLMSRADYAEREIAAARRIYNQHVAEFNGCLFQWPTCVPAAALNLSTFALFEANETQKKDVKLDLSI